jgi:hypothetical protein
MPGQAGPRVTARMRPTARTSGTQHAETLPSSHLKGAIIKVGKLAKVKEVGGTERKVNAPQREHHASRLAHPGLN